ncbi:MAG TPA: exosortase/archaeosortase family protein, partial [Planctomycetota bacterium]|nr:exosortase/archaeosortase family protein [Planctomycetota bacterium]
IPFISLYFVWTKKDALRRLEPRPCLWGLPLFLLGVLLAFFSMPLLSAVASGLSIVVILNALLLYLGGVRVYRLLWLPALYLFFMVPLPPGLHTMFANPLQQFASFVSAEILSGIFNVFVSRSGNVIRLAGHQLQVAEACSGMRSIMGLTALGVAFAYFWERPLWERLFLVCSTVPIAILANICRVTGTGLMYHWGYERFAQGFYHEFTGWFVYIYAMVLFLLEAWVMTHLFVYDVKPATAKTSGERESRDKLGTPSGAGGGPPT